MAAAMRVRCAAAVMLALAALACFPAGASARPVQDRPTKHWLEIEVEGSNGYSIRVSVNPYQRLTLDVTKEDQATKEQFSAEYMTWDAAADTDRVKAKLPGLGTVSVRFHPRGRVRHPSVPGCGRKRPTVQPGVARGTIKFTGERGYTQVKVHEADAAIEGPMGWFCRYAAESELNPREREWTSKFLASGEGVYLLVRKYRPGLIEGGRVLYWAETGETFVTASGRRLPLTIRRHLSIPAPASTFDDAYPEQLTVSPPPPFSGTGSLARTPESVFTWEGDLAVQFPGLDPTPLVGPGLESNYCLREVGCFSQRFGS
jgi:hypothetical protein